jgi:fido (protein-threonine AMPylation protein)
MDKYACMFMFVCVMCVGGTMNDFSDFNNDKENDYKINLLVACFLGYKYMKQSNTLYSNKGRTSKALIRYYFNNDFERLNPNVLNKSFLDRYIKNENLVEEVSNPDEREGIKVMYDKMLELPEDAFSLYSRFSLFGNREIKPDIRDFHSALFSKSDPNGYIAGQFRNTSVYLNEWPCEIIEPRDIPYKLEDLNYVFEDIQKLGIYMKNSGDYSRIFDYIKMCVKLNCELIKAQPFEDGNKRVSRCFLNKMFIIAGIPPVYIKENERGEYHRGLMEAVRERFAANEVNDDSKYDILYNFYLYKICDSII